ncbi:base excision DNA repair protein [Karstenula rhodostoma CBS 690.94]|uniref:Base excision DNA repair protein n=1 Tax=Karstenula rhodostoma CBS 690.94 TaxID=1392251 RepID=A0A9P4PHS4_9PLEO|nr:base excision DNA repair protein [Karstenula rhodostoma CBS 690.94]
MARASTARQNTSKTNPKASSRSKASTQVKVEESPQKIKDEDGTPTKIDASLKRSAPATATRRSKRIKTENNQQTGLPSPSGSTDSETDSEADFKPKPKTKAKAKSVSTATTKGLSSKKLQAYFTNAGQSPFPTFKHPTRDEAKLAHRILASLHGERTRPKEVVASKDRAGCGDSPSVLDALVRTILSQNTSDKNSTRAKQSMDEVYGGSDQWDAIVAGGESKLQKAIQSGGLSVVKSKVIVSILRQAKAKYGEYTLDHLHQASNEDAMREMLSFQGVGPKTASCVLLFCLQRESFAVDTHVHRITGLLGWRPKTASRDETHSHLDVMIPDEDKYGLHILLVKHGKVCEECKAGGKNSGKCELRKAFRQSKIKEETGGDVDQEEAEQLKEEDGDIKQEEQVQEE